MPPKKTKPEVDVVMASNEEKPEPNFKKGQIIADVKILEVDGGYVHFKTVKRNPDTKAAIIQSTIKNGAVIGKEVVWDSERVMTKSDFNNYIEARKVHFSMPS